MWELLSLLKEHKATSVKKVYKLKRNVKGKIKRSETILAAKDCNKKAKIYYDKAFF